MDFIGSELVRALSGWGAFMVLCFSLVRAVTKGDMVPGARYNELREDYAELKKDYREQGKMIDALLEQGKTTIALLQGIRSAAGDSDDRVGDRT